MFTAEQLIAAHKRVKSGADFPKYIYEISLLGVTSYSTFVHDGHTEFSGNETPVGWPAKYAEMLISGTADAPSLVRHLQLHQHGGSDYLAFCAQAAASGVAKWTVDLGAMTCTYYDKQGNNMLEEQIPAYQPQ